jgi:hypothetical protein
MQTPLKKSISNMVGEHGDGKKNQVQSGKCV